MTWVRVITQNLKEQEMQDLVLLVVSRGAYQKALLFNIADGCNRTRGRVQFFGQADLSETGLAFPSVNVWDIVATRGSATDKALATKGHRCSSDFPCSCSTEGCPGT